jgi:hypothetical protein
MMLRWFWWRINAWSEITATIVPIITFSLLKFNWDVTFPYSLFITVSITTISWLIVTFLTRPTDEVTLDNFCRVVRPEFGWKSIYSRLEIAPVRLVTSQLLFQLVFAIILTYSILFLVGKIIFQEFSSATLWFAIGLVSFFGLYFSMKKSK